MLQTEKQKEKEFLRFIELSHTLETIIKKEKTEKALKQYKRLKELGENLAKYSHHDTVHLINAELHDKLEKINKLNESNPLATKIGAIIFIPLLIILTIFGVSLFLNIAPTGFVAYDAAGTYTIDIDKTFYGSTDYLFIPEVQGKLASLKVSGTVKNQGSAKIYLQTETKNILIYDSTKKTKPLSDITAMVIANTTDENTEADQSFLEEESVTDNATIETESTEETNTNSPELPSTNNNLEENPSDTPSLRSGEFINNETEITEETLEETTTETTALTLVFTQETSKTTTDQPITLSVASSNIPESLNQDNLCTKYKIFSEETEETTTLCYGAEQCCNLIGLAPSRATWDAPFTAIYGRNGLTYNNLVAAQLIYVDISLVVENPYSEIEQSETEILPVAFENTVIAFNNACQESCILNLPEDNAYTLLIELENTSLKIDSITYTLAGKKPAREGPIGVILHANATSYWPSEKTIIDFLEEKDFTTILIDAECVISDNNCPLEKNTLQELNKNLSMIINPTLYSQANCNTLGYHLSQNTRRADMPTLYFGYAHAYDCSTKDARYAAEAEKVGCTSQLILRTKSHKITKYAEVRTNFQGCTDGYKFKEFHGKKLDRVDDDNNILGTFEAADLRTDNKKIGARVVHYGAHSQLTQAGEQILLDSIEWLRGVDS